MTNFTPHAFAPARLARSTALALLALTVGSLVFWSLRLGSMPKSEPDLGFVTTPAEGWNPDGLRRALGGGDSLPSGPAPVARSTLKLAGVMALGQGRGTALISIDGQKAQAYETGQVVQAGVYLMAVEPRGVRLGTSPQGPVTETLELPPPALPKN